MLVKKIKNCSLFITFIFFIFIIPFFFLNAEDVAENDETSYFDLSFSPTTPGPEDRVEVVTESNIDLSKKIIEWVVNDSLYEKKRGLEKITLKTGVVGETLVIAVKVDIDNQTVEKRIKITPIDINIVWQTDTYTPVLYKGKALSPYSNEGVIDFIALPKFTDQKTVEDPQDYIFDWEVPGSEFTLSGRGEDVFTVDLSEVSHNSMILLKTKHIKSGLVTQKNISLPDVGNPEVLIYKKDEYGINYNKSLSHKEKVVLENPTIRLISEPLFFSGSSVKQKKVDINWFMNNKHISDFQNSFTVLFSVDKNFSGISSVSVTINNRNNFRERVSSQVILEAKPNHY